MNGVDLSWLVSLFKDQAFTNMFSALFGALVGSVTGYWFNQRLEKRRTKERYLIQRKNTIYSPMYKEVLALNEYLESVQKGTNRGWQYVTEVSFSDDYSRDFTFDLWENIKKDIRKTYFHKDQQMILESLTNKLRTQMKLQEKVYSDLQKIVEDFVHANARAVKEDRHNIRGTIRYNLDNHLFAFAKNREALADQLGSMLTFTPEEAKREAKSLLRKARNLNSYKKMKAGLSEAILESKEATDSLEKIIVSIVNKQEGGIKID